MIEAAMIWNEPNNKSHWDPEIDPGWARFAEMATAAARRSAMNSALAAGARRDFAYRPRLHRQYGQPRACSNTSTRSASTASRSTGTCGKSTSGRPKLEEIRAVTDLPVWVTEVGASSFGAEEIAGLGAGTHRRTADRYARRAFTGTASTICPEHGKRRPGTRRPRVRPITGTSAWGCCARTGPRRRRPMNSPNTRPRLASANGSISRTIGCRVPSIG